MRNHFDQNLNVKELIEREQPEWVLELGVAGGKNTEALMSVVSKVVAVDINNIPSHFFVHRDAGKLEWITGVSYLEIPKLKDVPFVILDTDHNGWTLARELAELDRVCAEGAIICIHDTVSFSGTNGTMGDNGYHGLADYPIEEMQNGLSMRQALEAFLETGWKKIRETWESQGAVAIRRET